LDRLQPKTLPSDTLRSERALKRSRVTKATTNPTGEADAQKAMRYLSAIFSHFETDYAGDLPVLPQGNVIKVLAKKRTRPLIKRRERTLNLSERLALIGVLWD